MNRIHTITVPYAVMKACPMSWVQRVHIHKGFSQCPISLHYFKDKIEAFFANVYILQKHVFVGYSEYIDSFVFNEKHSTCAAHNIPFYPIARVALVKCRDLHWAMMAHKDQRDSSLSSIRMLIVADGANPCESHALCNKELPWYKLVCMTISTCFGNVFYLILLLSGSVSSCDAFLNVFQSHGLKPEVICPCATSPEALTVAIRRYV